MPRDSLTYKCVPSCDLLRDQEALLCTFECGPALELPRRAGASSRQRRFAAAPLKRVAFGSSFARSARWLLPALFWCGADAAARLGLVTMTTPEIMSYANATAAENQRYAERWGYGFHTVDHAVDTTRVPHWSKLHAVQLFLPEYDYVLWIDADAAIFDHTRKIEDVMQVAKSQKAEMWAQDIWPDYPSIQRNELIDTGIVLFRNSRWVRNFLTELYYYGPCQKHLNWTEQYCFTVAYNNDFLGMRERMQILPTPVVNHHILPPPDDPGGMFILHLAGRPSKARSSHFNLLHDGFADRFRGDRRYEAFWNFRGLFANHRFGGIASLQVCLFGMGERHRLFLDALLFHFPYISSFTVIRHGAPSLYTQMRATEDIGERYPDRMAYMDVKEYVTGTTRDGDDFVEGFFCDVFVLGVESWRHLPAVDVLARLARSGLENDAKDKNKGFGYSGIRDTYFALLYDGCGAGAGGAAAVASGAAAPSAPPKERLDPDDEDGSAIVAACELLGTTRSFLERHANSAQNAADSGDAGQEEVPLLWSINAPGERGFQASGDVALARLPREAFVTS
eukprot:TRINITY_DN22760_c1_g1_i1.p1 TRINITY_DN22760_c1_g1~~TRINITY_DN22760_c1_g1_i1.p1  ORF type:complete len:565 (+),score=128.75 TRINITY_DN22760_c1_g1_i1:86-1780(+)